MNDLCKIYTKNPEMKKSLVFEIIFFFLEKIYRRYEVREVMGCCFKYLVPDLIMMMEHIAGLDPVGCLSEGESFIR